MHFAKEAALLASAAVRAEPSTEAREVHLARVQAKNLPLAAHVGGGIHCADDGAKGHEGPVLVLPHTPVHHIAA